jgi:transposase
MHEDPAESGSVGPIEGVSEDFSKVNKGSGCNNRIYEGEKLEQRLNESEEERMILRREKDELSTTVKVLKEKTAPELLHELQEKFLKSCKRTQDMYLFYFVKNNHFR